METYILILVGLFGVAVGSFLNVLIYRMPRDIPFAAGRSLCPSCGSRLKWYHNIPLVSFIFLRGKCGYCAERIPWRYPVVELLNGTAWVYLWWYLGSSYSFIVWALFVSALIVIFFVDIEHQIIPDLITLPGIGLGLAASLLPGGIGIISAAVGMLVGGGALYLVALLGDLLFKKESMGGGDIKMAAMLGTFLGWQKVLLVFISAAAIGLVVSLVMLGLSTKLRENRMIPFGPFLAVAAVISAFYGDTIIHFYLTTFVQVH